MDDDMIGSGISMTAGRNVARALTTALVMLLVVVAGFTGSAMAAAPEIVISQPLAGSSTNSQTPSFRGTSNDTVDSVTLKIYAGASAEGSPIQTPTELVPVEVGSEEASWEITPKAALVAGQYTAVAEQTNVDSETGLSTSVTFTVDTISPAVSINVVASPTEDPRPTLAGGAGVEAGDEPSVAVVIYSGSLAEGTVVAAETVGVSKGAWSYTAPLLADGTYTVQAYQRDEADNIGSSAPMTFAVDTKPPVVSMNTLSALTNDPEPKLAGTAGVAVGDAPIVTVSIHEGESVSGKVVASGKVSVSAGAWSYPAPHLADGTYTAQASQSNESFEVGTTAAETFIVDTTPPAVSLTTPADDAVLRASRPKFSGRAGRASGDDQLVTLKIYKGGAVSGTPTQEVNLTPDGNEWSTGTTGPALANGIYTALAEQSDQAGNTGTSAATFTIDTNSPEVTLYRSGFVMRGIQLLTGPEPSFSGSGGSEPEDSTTVVVKVYSGTSTAGTPVRTVETALSGSAWTSGHVEALPDGTYTVQAEQEDSSPFSQTGVSESATFTVDANPPQVTLTSPTNGSSISRSSQTVSGAAGTAEGDLTNVTVQLYAGSAIAGEVPLEAITVQATGEDWSAVFGGLNAGTYTAQAEQGDDVGNTGHSEPVTFTVTTTPETAQSIPSAPAASFKWIPSAPQTGEPVTLVSTSTDTSSPITSFAWAPAGDGAFTQGESALTTSFSTPGSHVVQLRVTDASGGSSVATETITVGMAPVPLMQPFPVVRMAGSYDATGAKISLLAVLAPVGAKVAITCRGPHCPAKSQAFLAVAGTKSKAGTVLVTFRRFERQLRAGVTLKIWVSKHGEIGKFTRFAIHRGKSPSRVDECLNPAATTPIVCPS